MTSALPSLPHTFRPRWGRRIPYAVAVLILAVFGFLAVALPDWPVLDRTLVVLTGLAIVWFLHRLADVRVVADDEGLTVVNVLRSERLEWAEVVGVRLGQDDAWLVLDVSDGTTLAAMGIQGSDGAYSALQAQQVARLVDARSRPAAA